MLKLQNTYVSSISVVSPPADVLITAFNFPFASPFTLYLNLMHVPAVLNIGETTSALDAGFLGLLASKNKKYPKRIRKKSMQ